MNSIYDLLEFYKKQGLGFEDAIEEIQARTHTEIDRDVIALARREWDFRERKKADDAGLE